jgi:hypothetical protein
MCKSGYLQPCLFHILAGIAVQKTFRYRAGDYTVTLRAYPEIFSKSPAVYARIRKNLQKLAVFQELMQFFAHIGDNL